MLFIPKSQVDQFNRAWQSQPDPQLTYGQAFSQHFMLDRSVSKMGQKLAQKLATAPKEVAQSLIVAVTDFSS